MNKIRYDLVMKALDARNELMQNSEQGIGLERYRGCKEALSALADALDSFDKCDFDLGSFVKFLRDYVSSR